MSDAADIEELAEQQEMTGYLRQGMLMGHLLQHNVRAHPVMEGENYSKDKLTIRMAHPTKDGMTIVYTLVTESAVDA